MKKTLIAFCVIFFVGVLIVFILSGGIDMFGKKVVGKNIKNDQINDFYYTLSASTFPPEYQRYRFYTEDGKYFFYHEKREGDHWPLTEDDATVKGLSEISKAEWDEFLGYIEGGNVTRRSKLPATTGNRSYFIYWEKDKSEFQVFEFETYEKRLQFEDLSEKLATR